MASLPKQPRKTKYLGARTDEEFDKRINAYMKASNISMGDLVRKGTEEYMQNHPVKPPEPSLKPGE